MYPYFYALAFFFLQNISAIQLFLFRICFGELLWKTIDGRICLSVGDHPAVYRPPDTRPYQVDTGELARGQFRPVLWTQSGCIQSCCVTRSRSGFGLLNMGLLSKTFLWIFDFKMLMENYLTLCWGPRLRLNLFGSALGIDLSVRDSSSCCCTCSPT